MTELLTACVQRCLDGKQRDVDSTLPLLSALRALLAPRDVVLPALTAAFEFLDDALIDNPLAFKFVGQLLAHLLSIDAVALAQLTAPLEPSVESGTAAKVLAHTLVRRRHTRARARTSLTHSHRAASSACWRRRRTRATCDASCSTPSATTRLTWPRSCPRLVTERAPS